MRPDMGLEPGRALTDGMVERSAVSVGWPHQPIGHTKPWSTPSHQPRQESGHTGTLALAGTEAAGLG